MSDENEKMNQFKNEANEVSKMAANAATGNLLGTAKNAIKLSKNKKIAKKMILKYVMPIFITILVITILASAVFTIFTTIKEKMIELASNIKTAVSGFWKWFKDDYWIKLDEEIEVTVYDDSGRRNKKRYYISR